MRENIVTKYKFCTRLQIFGGNEYGVGGTYEDPQSNLILYCRILCPLFSTFPNEENNVIKLKMNFNFSRGKAARSAAR